MTSAICSHCHEAFQVLGIQPSGQWFCSTRCVKGHFSEDEDIAVRTQTHHKIPHQITFAEFPFRKKEISR